MRVLLFDIFSGGHHAEYLTHLLEHRDDLFPGVTFDIAITKSLLESSPRLLDSIEGGRSRVIPIEPVSGSGLTRQALQEARVFKGVVKQVRPDYALSLYADHLQLGLALGMRFSFPVGLGGIYFRPTFHYTLFDGNEPKGRSRLRTAQKRLMLRLALRNPHLAHWFCIDPLAVEYAREHWKEEKLIALRDPVNIPSTWSPSGRLESYERKRLVIPGYLDRRKGIEQLFDAIALLPGKLCERLHLVLAGERSPELIGLESRLEDLRLRHVTIDLMDRRLDDEAFQDIFLSADLLGLLYQGDHVGSSGVLLRAARLGIPVIATNDGLVGHYVRNHSLGMAVDATSPASICRALTRWLNDESIPHDANVASSFVRDNTPLNFADTILSHIHQYVSNSSTAASTVL
jgi:glycosyltransferase involved in cell wall biosynthesis